MSNLLQKINEDIKQSMLSKDAEKLSVLRMLSAALQNKEISLRQGEGKVELNDEQIIETVQSEIKKRRESMEVYISGQRPELAAKEKNEIEILNGYLPEQLPDNELEKIIKDIIAEIGGTPNFGQVMGQAMTRAKGKADGNRISALVKQILQ